MSRLRFAAPPQPLDLERFPKGLSELDHPPEALFVAGTWPTERPAVAVVGTRAADPEHRRFAHELAAELARAGVLVVSGGALGIDAAAHRGALEAGAETVAVLASGLVQAYPPEHAPLFEQIATQGAVVCEREDTTPHPGRFLERNRLVAAITRATVVVQAPARSGALSTAAIARQLGRWVLAVPSAPWDRRSAGSTALLTRGALACLGARQVLEVLERPLPDPVKTKSAPKVARRMKAPTTKRAPATPSFEGDTATLFAVLTATPTHRDELVARSGLDVPRMQRALLELVLAGAANEHPDGRVVRVG